MVVKSLVVGLDPGLGRILHTFIFSYLHKFKKSLIWESTSTYMNMHVHTCSPMHTHGYTCSYMFTHVHTCSPMYTHVHTRIHMYTHVYTCTLMYKRKICGEPLWVSGKVMKWENKLNQKIRASLPSPDNLFFKKNSTYVHKWLSPSRKLRAPSQTFHFCVRLK
jgi:hypothetical protein